MKKTNRIIIGLLFLAIIGCNIGKAQGTGDSFSSLNLSALSENGVLALSGTNIASFQTFSDAELAELVNVLEAVPTIPASSVPNWATCWSLQTPSSPPLPGDLIGVGVWPMEDGSFLLDDLSGSTSSSMGMRAMDDGSPLIPGGGGDGGDYISYTNDDSVIYNTNLLYLTLTNVEDGIACANIYNATDSVYAIWSATNLDLPLTNWQVETEVWPTDTNCMNFTVYTHGRQDLFLRAEDWTGVTENGNTTPDWWFWLYYGTTELYDTNLDSQGNQLVADYLAGMDPNLIKFSVTATNNYVNSQTAQLQLNVTAGLPFYVATMVNSTNFSQAVWSEYNSSNINVNLGSTQGWQDVWVGLRGFPTNAVQTWCWEHINFATAPVLSLTNPTTSVVDEPLVQIYGYCQEPLSSISYSVSNALGQVSGLPAEITDQYYDTNHGNFTTNYFECLDVPLITGLNIVTIQAEDLAGSTTTTNFDFTLDYSNKTNPPSLMLDWPLNGMEISGGTFTCKGQLGDSTATVILQVANTINDTNSDTSYIYTNSYVASVERNGTFWLENVPLSAGTNTFTIEATDAVGNMTTTNLTVIGSALSFAISPVTPSSQLWQSTVNLTGTVSDPTYAVWVNGVKGHNNGNGTWYANGVPVNTGGTATFAGTAYAPTEEQPDGSYGN